MEEGCVLPGRELVPIRSNAVVGAVVGAGAGAAVGVVAAENSFLVAAAADLWLSGL